MKTIAEWQEHVHRIAREKGWWPELDSVHGMSPEAIAARLMLIVSECSEALEELRVDPADLEEVVISPNGKPVGFAVELADAAIRIMDLCSALGIDLQEAIEVKSAYNETRPHRHGGRAL